ncbi:MAG: NAD kinase [Erysipelotrichaceae bacterium]
MKFTCYSNSSAKSENAKKQIENKLVTGGWQLENDSPDLVISVGGDGTVLAAVQKYLADLERVVFLGVNTGTLGFFTDYQGDEIDCMIEELLSEKVFTIEKKRLIVGDVAGKKYYALNEIRLENNIHTQIFDVTIDGKWFETYRGSGLNFSSQAGSTGYNRSLRGAILDDSNQNLQMSEISPISNRHFRTLGYPLVLNSERTIELSWENKANIILGYDHLVTDLCQTNKVKIKLSDKEVRFIHYRNIDFLDRIKLLY